MILRNIFTTNLRKTLPNQVLCRVENVSKCVSTFLPDWCSKFDKSDYSQSQPYFLSVRYFSSVGFGKKYTNTENLAAHAVLEAIPKYRSSLIPDGPTFEGVPAFSPSEYDSFLAEDWDTKSDCEVLEGFRRVTAHVHSNDLDVDISHQCFDKLCQGLIKQSSIFNFDKLCQVLQYMSLWKLAASLNAHNFYELWNAVDQACVVLLHTLTRPQRMLLCDHWYRLNLAAVNKFNWRCINSCSRKHWQLTPEELVQCLFYINLMRKFPPEMDSYAYQSSLEKHLNKLSASELGVCAMGFFKTQKKIRSETILKDMLTKVTAEAKTIDPVLLGAFLKVFRMCLPATLAVPFYHLLEILRPRIPELPLICCTHVALAGTNLHMLHKELMAAVLERCIEELPSARLKDIERLLLALTMFNWPAELPGRPGENVYELLAAEVLKPHIADSLEPYPRTLVNVMHYFTMVGMYPQQLIDRALGTEFAKRKYFAVTESAGQETLSLDVAVEVECPEYKGNKLSHVTRWNLAKMVSIHPKMWEDLTDFHGPAGLKQLKEMALNIHKLLPDPSHLYMGHLLPNYRYPDLLVRVSDKDPSQFLPIPQTMREMELGDVKRPEGEGRWVCLVMGGWNLLLRDTSEPVGGLRLKLRLLSKLGYLPVLIPWTEWTNQFQRKVYLARKISAAVSSDNKPILAVGKN